MKERNSSDAGSMLPRPARAVALTALTHPAAVAALVLLIVNDHVLKPLIGNAVTGKLSDLAGLVFFPILVALTVSMAIPRTTPSAARAIGLTVTALWFGAIKAWAPAARATEALVETITPWSSRIVADPTDLLALPMLAATWHIWAASERRPRSTNTALRIVVLTAALFATAATSCEEPPAVTDLVRSDGAVWTDTGQGVVPITDGTEVWRFDATGRNDRELDGEDVPRYDGRTTESCAPSDPTTCFRIVDGASIEQSSDGGDSWATVWTYGDRQDFIDRANQGDCWAYSASLDDLVVLDGPMVVVAAASDGVLIGYPDGTWDRNAVWQAAPLTDFGEGFTHEQILAAALGLLAFVIGSSTSWPRLAAQTSPTVGWHGTWLVTGRVLFVAALIPTLLPPYGLFGGLALLGSLVAVALLSPAIGIPWLRIRRSHPSPRIVDRQLVRVAGAAGLIPVVAVAPLYSWSAGFPAAYSTAISISIAALIAVSLAGWRWISRPLPQVRPSETLSEAASAQNPPVANLSPMGGYVLLALCFAVGQSGAWTWGLGIWSFVVIAGGLALTSKLTGRVGGALVGLYGWVVWLVGSMFFWLSTPITWAIVATAVHAPNARFHRQRAVLAAAVGLVAAVPLYVVFSGGVATASRVDLATLPTLAFPVLGLVDRWLARRHDDGPSGSGQPLGDSMAITQSASPDDPPED